MSGLSDGSWPGIHGPTGHYVGADVPIVTKAILRFNLAGGGRELPSHGKPSIHKRAPPRARARRSVGREGTRAGAQRARSKGIWLLASCVWSGYRSLVPVPVSLVREAARHGRRGGQGLGRERG